MKTISHCLMLFLSFQLGLHALPDEARREIQRLRKFESDARKKVEKELIEEKEDAIKKLEKLSRSIKDDKQKWIKNLATIQIKKYQSEIEKSERIISGKRPDKKKADDLPVVSLESIKNAEKIINFGDTYTYRHPSEDYKSESCEITLEKDGTAHVTHSEGKEVKFDKLWTWKWDDNRIKIDADKAHGPIYITRRGIREIYVEYRGRIRNKVSAKVK